MITPGMIILVFVFLIIVFLVFDIAHSLVSLKTGRILANDIKYAGTYSLGEDSKKPIRVLVDGDSIAAGVAASSFNTSVAGRFGNHLAQKHRVTLINQAVSGSKMRDLLSRNMSDKKFNITLLIISSNDLFRFTNAAQFRLDTANVIKRYANNTDNLIIVGPGKVYGTGGVPFLMKPFYFVKASTYSNIIKEEIAKYQNVVYINPHDRLRLPKYGDTEAEDNFHPNDEGHKYWSDMAKLGLSRTKFEK